MTAATPAAIRPMISPPELIERWTNAGRVLNLMPEHERQNHWDMSAWGKRTQCGTVACAAGHCGLDPWFREREFKLDIDPTSGAVTISDVPGFFGLEGSSRIFYNGRQRSVETVLGEVTSYVTELQKIAEMSAHPGLPSVGGEWPEQGGVFAGARLGINDAPDYFLIVGPEHDGGIDWPDATNWAGRLSIAGHNDFGLPRRSEGYALFDRVRSLFEPRGYWLAEQHAECSSYAWCQYFNYGSQDNWGKDYKLRARAVRRVLLSDLAL